MGLSNVCILHLLENRKISSKKKPNQTNKTKQTKINIKKQQTNKVMIFNKSGRKLKGYSFIYAQQSIG